MSHLLGPNKLTFASTGALLYLLFSCLCQSELRANLSRATEFQVRRPAVVFDLEFPSLLASLLGERFFLTPVCFNAWTKHLLLHSSSPLLHRPEPTLKSEPKLGLELGFMPRLGLVPVPVPVPAL